MTIRVIGGVALLLVGLVVLERGVRPRAKGKTATEVVRREKAPTPPKGPISTTLTPPTPEDVPPGNEPIAGQPSVEELRAIAARPRGAR